MLRLHTCSLSFLVTYEQGGGMRIVVALWLSVVSLLSTHAFRSYIWHGMMMLWVRGGVRVIPWHWHVWYSNLREYYADARFYLVSPMCDIYLERYIGVWCTGLYVKLEVLWSVHFPLAYTLTVTLRLKNQVLSSWLKEKRSNMNKGQTKDYETTASLCAVSGSCLVQLPRSFIDSFIKGCTNLRVEYNEGQSVSVCSV